MGITCIVHKCPSRLGYGSVKFFRYPATNYYKDDLRILAEKREKAWRRVIKKENLPKKAFICELHFISKKSAKLTDYDNPDWIPSVNLGYVTSNRGVKTKLDRFERYKQRLQKKTECSREILQKPEKNIEGFIPSSILGGKDEYVCEESELLLEHQIEFAYKEEICTQSNVTSKTKHQHEFDKEIPLYADYNSLEEHDYYQKNNEDEQSSNTTDACVSMVSTDAVFMIDRDVQTTNVETDYDKLKKELEKCYQLNDNYQSIISNLEKKLKLKQFGIPSLKCSDKITKYFTGINSYIVLLHIFDFVKDYIEESPCKILTIDQMFIMTLRRLRLNEQLSTLAYLYDVSLKSASYYYHSTLFVLYKRLKGLVKRPSREDLKTHMPASFKAVYGDKVTVIIDCFEIFMENPSKMLAGCNVHSSYKHHNTIKVLIGIAANGAIMHISEAFRGNSSDKYGTEHSGFLNKLQDGDFILADRGFLIHDSVKQQGAQLNIPAFKKNGTQIEAVDLETSKKLASLRIHVERVIGVLRQKYLILYGTIPITTLERSDNGVCIINQILYVTSALMNMCPILVSK